MAEFWTALVELLMFLLTAASVDLAALIALSI